MDKIIFLALFLLTISTTHVHSKYYTCKPYEPIKLQKTHLRFFLHDIISGTKRPSAVQIGDGPNKSKPNDRLPFGTLFAIDDVITEGPHRKSKVIGNARGMYLSSSQGKDLTLVLYIDYSFTTGKFNGSSISVFSRNPLTETNREVAVVGGRGLFRQAQGWAIDKTRSLSFTTGNALIEYNVEVVHPCWDCGS